MDFLSWSSGTSVVSAMVLTLAIASSKSIAILADAPPTAATPADTGSNFLPAAVAFSPNFPSASPAFPIPDTDSFVFFDCSSRSFSFSVVAAISRCSALYCSWLISPLANCSFA